MTKRQLFPHLLDHQSGSKSSVILKSDIVWDVIPCSLLNVSRHFRGTYRLHLQGQISRASWLAIYFHTGVLLGLFDPEDGGDNVPPKHRLT
jgi:hypothetical protein